VSVEEYPATDTILSASEQASVPLAELFVLEARTIIEMLDLSPHPEGGWFRETWRSAPYADGRSAGTTIYFLLAQGEHSRWHRIDADETWHFYGGEPIELRLRQDERVSVEVLGADFGAGQRPQIVVPAGVWQCAFPVGAWALSGCTVAPGFMFSGFELEPEPS
jgi:hypothetical protein